MKYLLPIALTFTIISSPVAAAADEFTEQQCEKIWSKEKCLHLSNGNTRYNGRKGISTAVEKGNGFKVTI